MTKFHKVFLVAVGISGVLLVVLLTQLSGARAENPAVNLPAPTLVAAAALPVLPTSTTPPLPQTTPTLQVLPSPTPLPPTPTISTATRPANTRSHIVRSGETLVQIAEQYGATLDELIALNHLSASGAINDGQLLLVPVPPPTPTPAQPAVTVNNLPLDAFLIMPPDVQENVRAIYARGLALGRDPYSFSVIGDSTVEMLNFLTGFETGSYHLGDYSYLQPVLTHYAGSFARPRMAVEQGIHSRQVFLDTFADPEYCEPGESMIDCEWRLHNPSVVLIRIGSNDGKPDIFDREVRRMVEYALERGTIPVIGTKADQYLDPGYVNNGLLRQIAQEYRLPLWDFQLVAQTLPNSGLLPDQVHLTLFLAFDWRLPEAFTTGHGLQNLTALMALYDVLAVVQGRPVR